MPGGSGGWRSRSRNTSQDLSQTLTAWVNAGAAKIDYNTAYLMNGEKVRLVNVTDYMISNASHRSLSSGRRMEMHTSIYFRHRLDGVLRSRSLR
jgi:hypothetical protein